MLNFGGPVWHASVASTHKSFAALRQEAKGLLFGVGDPSLGEWVEEAARHGRRFVHIKRRLRPSEQLVTGPAVDVRGTEEEARRVAACPWLPVGWRE